MKQGFNKRGRPAQAYATARAYMNLFAAAHLNVMLRLLMVTAILAVVLYVLLFTTTPAIHDFFHELRHSLMIVPCH